MIGYLDRREVMSSEEVDSLRALLAPATQRYREG